MKKISTILIVLLLISCNTDKGYSAREIEEEKIYNGIIQSIRIDDDSEYHFNTDNIVKDDVDSRYVTIVRDTIDLPELYNMWRPSGCYWEVRLPNDYKIETFDD
jgi:hypothetical protein